MSLSDTMHYREMGLEVCNEIKKADLINLVNYIHFQDGFVRINFRNRKTDACISAKGKPEPCSADTIRCLWADESILNYNLSSYVFDSIYIIDGRNLVIILPDKPEDIRYDAEGIALRVPEKGCQSQLRATHRHACTNIDTILLQNGAIYKGKLYDFNPASFHLDLTRTPGQSFDWIISDTPVTVILKKDEQVMYSNECKIIRRNRIQFDRETIVVTPGKNNLSRFPPKKFRCMRHRLSPPPTIRFIHPFTERLVFLQTTNVSSSGVSVEEDYSNATLLPGMIIPEITLSFSGTHSITCVGQVLYRNVACHGNGDSIVHCGITFLDMSLSDQLDLSALLHHAIDHRSHVSNAVDLDALWKLFFESGFIYPEKYAVIHSNKEELKKTYEKLYLNTTPIARHFVYQDRGTLYAHMSMLRFYPNSWLIQHHLGKKLRKGRSALKVLDQVGFYVNEFHSLISTRMNFVMCYYRKENRFPQRVFGGVTRDMQNPKASSLDTFIYFTVPRSFQCSGTGSEYTLSQVTREDLGALEDAYEKISGGLMLDALNLKPDGEPDSELNGEYTRYGFARSQSVLALKYNRELSAVITVTRSDIGLNLSNLTNCIHIFLLEQIPLLTLYSVLGGLVSGYSHENVSVMLYPCSIGDKIVPDYKKTYTLWVLNLQNSDGYFDSLQKTFKRSQYGGTDELAR